MTTTENKKKKFLKVFLVVFSSIILLLLIAFWLLTSSAFLTGVVLPAVSSSINMRITAEKIDLSIFGSRLKAVNVSVGPEKATIAQIEKLDAGFSLGSLLSGDIALHDVLLDKAAIKISQDSISKDAKKVPTPAKKTPSLPKKQTKRSESKKMEKVVIDLKNIRITNSSFILTAGDVNGVSSSIELKDINISLPEFKNNQPAKLTFSSLVSLKSDSGITVDRGKWNLTLDAAFDEYLLPYELKLASKLDELDGTINGVKINKSNLSLDIDAHGDKKSIVVEKFSLRQNDNDSIKTNVEINSYINFQPFKIKGKLKVDPLSSEISSIICQFVRQINPGMLGVNWISDFEYSEYGFSATGKFALTRSGDAIINAKKYELPNLLFQAHYDVAFIESSKALQIKYFNTSLDESGKKVLTFSIDRPLIYSFENQSFSKKKKPQAVLEIRQLDLSLLKLLLPPEGNFVLNSGRLDGDLACILDHKKKISFGANLRAAGLDMKIGSTRLKDIGLQHNISGFVSKNLFLSIPKFRLDVTSKEDIIVGIAGFANADFNKETADFSLNLNNFSSNKFALLPLDPETIESIVDVTRKMEVFTLDAKTSGKFSKRELYLNPVNLNIFQNKKKVISLAVTPFKGMAKNFANNSKAVLTINKLPVAQFKQLIKDKSIVSGDLDGKIIADIKSNFKSIAIDSSLNINNLELDSMQKIFKALRVNLATSATLLDFDKIKIKNIVCGLRQNKQIIMGLSGYGKLNIPQGDGNMQMTLNYLNHHFLNILTGAELRSGIIKGALRIDLKNKFKSAQLRSKLNIVKLTGGSANEAVDGKVAFAADLKPELFHCKEFTVSIESERGKIIDLSGSTILPENISDKNVVIDLKSKIIDIGKIQQIFNIKEKKTTVKEATYTISDTPAFVDKAKDNEPAPLSFDLGPKKYLLDIDLRGIKYNSVLTARVDGKIYGAGKNINVKRLQIFNHKDMFNIRGDFLSTVRGIKYDIDMKSDKFNLSPIFKTFLADDFKGTHLTLKNFHTNASGIGLLPLGLWDNMKGFVKSDFEDVRVPNTLSKTSVGKILLLPFKIMVDIQKMIPSKALEAMGQVAQYVIDFQNNIKVIAFSDGKMDLNSQDGRIYIRNFYLRGKIVRNLLFYGDYGLGSDQNLKLKSRLNINGIILPVDIAGTINDPKINYTKTTFDFMKANTFNILDTTGKILEKGSGDVKDILKIILDR